MKDERYKGKLIGYGLSLKMGKGDIKTRRGKIFRGSYGKVRRKPKKVIGFIREKKTSAEIVKPNRPSGWFKRKKYLHFSPRIRDENRVYEIVSDTDRITNHNFYPLIHRVVKQRRYKKLIDKDRNEYRSHYDKVKKCSTTKVRHILYANHLDAAIYSFYTKCILSPLYEAALAKKDISECVSAYRRIPANSNGNKGKSNIHFANDVFQHIKERKEECVALAFDIRGFFDNLDHFHLKHAWSSLLGETEDKLPSDHDNIYKAITNFSYVSEKELLKMFDLLKYKDPAKRKKKASKLGGSYKGSNRYEREQFFREKICKGGLLKMHREYEQNIAQVNKGIPQGLPISALLANLYLMDYDAKINYFVKRRQGIYRRYSDDILIVCPKTQKEIIEEKVIEVISQKPFELEINTDKTETVFFSISDSKNNLVSEENKRLRYLGFEFDGTNTYVKSSALCKYHRRKKSHIKRRISKKERYQVYSSRPQRVWTSIVKKKYLHLKGRNFISYLGSASSVMNNSKILNQVRNRGIQLKCYLDRN